MVDASWTRVVRLNHLVEIFLILQFRDQPVQPRELLGLLAIAVAGRRRRERLLARRLGGATRAGPPHFAVESAVR